MEFIIVTSIKNISHGKKVVGFQHPAKDFFDILHLGFGQKRKQLQGNLSATYDKEAIAMAFKAAHISPAARAEDISLQSWLILVKELRKS